MLLIPAIDLKDGQCVRLRQGRMEDSTLFSADPLQVARRWVSEGTQRLHLVDLNGAFAGRPVNEAVIRSITTEFPDLPLQIGGGIRTLETIERYLEMGVDYCIVGTQAVRNPQFVVDACQAFPNHIIVGIDASQGKVATEGWADVSTVSALDLAQQFEQSGVSAIVYTDISRDGMMNGVNVEETLQLAKSMTIPVIASGGVTNMEDIKALQAVSHAGIHGAILGRALYEGTLVLAEAQRYIDQHLEQQGV